MKLISLNTWGCRITEPLFEFIRSGAESTDIFCFQEILKGGNGTSVRGERKGAYEDLLGLLPGHTGYFSAYGEGGYYSESSKNLGFEYGIATFVRKKSVNLLPVKHDWLIRRVHGATIPDGLL